MKATEYKGFSYVFRFTLMQYLKAGSFRVMFCLTLILAVAAPFILNAISAASGNKQSKSSIESVYVVNESGIDDLPKVLLVPAPGAVNSNVNSNDSQMIEKPLLTSSLPFCYNEKRVLTFLRHKASALAGELAVPCTCNPL